jgi:hypothetical protein
VERPGDLASASGKSSGIGNVSVRGNLTARNAPYLRKQGTKHAVRRLLRSFRFLGFESRHSSILLFMFLGENFCFHNAC